MFLNGLPQIVEMNFVFKVMRLHKHKKNLKKVCLKENAKQFQQRRSCLVRLRQPLVPSPPLLLSRVFAAPVLLPSRPGGSWREDKVRLKERLTTFSLQTEQCTGSPSWCPVQVLSQLLMSTTLLSSSQGNKAISYSHLLTESTDIA